LQGRQKIAIEIVEFMIADGHIEGDSRAYPAKCEAGVLHQLFPPGQEALQVFIVSHGGHIS